MKVKIKESLFLTAFAALTVAQPARAEWKNDLTLYLWGSSLSGNATVGRQKVPVEVSFDDLLDKLEFGIQAHYEGVGERWGAGLDFTYFEFSDTSDAGVEAQTNVELVEAFGLYRLNNNFDLLTGVRYAELDLALRVPGLVGAQGDQTLVDFFGGFRVHLPLSDTVKVGLRADAGAGDSDLVWNVVAGLSWQVSKSIAIRGGYRWLDYDVENDEAPLQRTFDMRLGGPFVGIGILW